jgi:hypothetical protein
MLGERDVPNKNTDAAPIVAGRFCSAASVFLRRSTPKNLEFLNETEKENNMSDHQEIRNLLATYCHLYDDGFIEEWGELFKHGAYTFMGKKFSGVKNILDWIIPTSVRNGVRHVNFNIAIHVDGEAATAKSDFVTVARDVTGMLKVDNPESVWGRYDDTLAKIDGRWWFVDRVVTLDNPEMTVTVWNWMRKNAAVYVERSSDLYS